MTPAQIETYVRQHGKPFVCMSDPGDVENGPRLEVHDLGIRLGNITLYEQDGHKALIVRNRRTNIQTVLIDTFPSYPFWYVYDNEAAIAQ